MDWIMIAICITALAYVYLRYPTIYRDAFDWYSARLEGWMVEVIEASERAKNRQD